MTNKAVNTLLSMIENSENICFLTGAGISTLSGIPDFQTTDEEWAHPFPREIAISRPFFDKSPDTFWTIYRQLFHAKKNAAPNALHHWIAGLESQGKKVEVVTQNVDGLHQLAGSSSVHAVHGNITSCVCVNAKCRGRFEDSFGDGTGAPLCPRCDSPLKPDVVLFGEYPKSAFQSESAVLQSDLLIVMGTSLAVHPIGGLPERNRITRPHTLQAWINKDIAPSKRVSLFDCHVVGEFSDFLNAVQ